MFLGLSPSDHSQSIVGEFVSFIGCVSVSVIVYDTVGVIGYLINCARCIAVLKVCKTNKEYITELRSKVDGVKLLLQLLAFKTTKTQELG